MSASNAALLGNLAQAEGVSRSTYLADLIGQAAAGTACVANGEAAPGRRELMTALLKSNSELAAIGRNLNQIARSLNSWPGRTTASDRDTLTATITAVSAHLDTASAVLGTLGTRRGSSAQHQSERAT